MSDLDDLFAAIQKQDTGVLETLLDRDPTLLTARSDGGRSPLLMASYVGAASIVESLLARGVVPDACEAAVLGDVDRLATIAAESSASLFSTGADGFTPLHFAAFFGQVDATRALLDHGADVAAVSANPMANTPLHAAIAGKRDMVVIRALLDAGASPSVPAADDYTPLHAAASRGDVELIDLLVSRGATPTLMKDGRSVADIAEDHGHPAVAATLRETAS